jgi:hypothetical protein
MRAPPGREFHPLKSSAFHGALLRQSSLRPANPRFTTAISRSNFPQLDNPPTSEHNLAQVSSKLPLFLL